MDVGSILEGQFRPGHFRGVATIVLKLFNVVRPTRAYFGQKDAQQVEVVRQLIRDLAVDVELRVLPVVGGTGAYAQASPVEPDRCALSRASGARCRTMAAP